MLCRTWISRSLRFAAPRSTSSISMRLSGGRQTPPSAAPDIRAGRRRADGSAAAAAVTAATRSMSGRKTAIIAPRETSLRATTTTAASGYDDHVTPCRRLRRGTRPEKHRCFVQRKDRRSPFAKASAEHRRAQITRSGAIIAHQFGICFLSLSKSVLYTKIGDHKHTKYGTSPTPPFALPQLSKTI